MKSLIKSVSFLAGVILIVWLVRSEWFTVIRTGDMDKIEMYFDMRPSAGLLITFILMVIQNFMTLIPLFLIITINLFLFDFWGGFFWSWLTSVVAGSIAFWLYRYWLHDFISRKVKKELMEKLQKNSWAVVFYLRVLPIAPTSLINMAAGASSMKLGQYAAATALGNLVHIFVASLIINGVMSADFEYYVLLGLFAIPLAVYAGMKRRKRRLSK